jgi:hypothetical protein
VRHHLFVTASYYPSGGMGDYVASFDTLDEARDYARTHVLGSDGWHVAAEVGGNLTEVWSDGSHMIERAKAREQPGKESDGRGVAAR